MKARIQKKLSKRATLIAPTLFAHAWRDDEISELAEKQRTSIRHVYSVGGELDYWGEGTDWCTVWDHVRYGYPFIGEFPQYPHGHELAYHPDTRGFRPSVKNLLKMLAEREVKALEKERRRAEMLNKCSGDAQ